MKTDNIYKEFSRILKVPVDSLLKNDNLESYSNWDSLTIIRVLPKLNTILGKKLKISEIFKAKTINQIILQGDTHD